MDVEIASAFQEVARLRVNESAVLKPAPLTGELLIKWVFLEEVGLLQEVNSNLHLDLSGSDGDVSIINTKKYCLLLKFNAIKENLRIEIGKIVERQGDQITYNSVEIIRNLCSN